VSLKKENVNMTPNEIIKVAYALGYTFTLEDAQDVIDSRPSWSTTNETPLEAVQDYLNAFGG
jgi:hypothetical protein